MTDDQLQDDLAAALTPPPADPPADRVAALRAHAARLRDTHPPVEPAPSATGGPLPRPGNTEGAPASRRLLLGLAAGVALLVGAGAIGAAVTSGADGSGDDLLARGTPEFSAVLADGDVTVDLDGSRAPEGRIVVVASDTLPVIPRGEYYELWFVGPEDSPGSPDRISAGTFHPDYDDGTTLVVLHAAVDPTLFPQVEITTETADGDPAPSDDVVLRGPVDLLDG